MISDSYRLGCCSERTSLEGHCSPISGVLGMEERRDHNRRPTATWKAGGRGQSWSERLEARNSSLGFEKDQWGATFSGSHVINRHPGRLGACPESGWEGTCEGWTGRTTRNQHHFLAARGFASFRDTTTNRPHAIPGCLGHGSMTVDVSSFPLRPRAAVL